MTDKTEKKDTRFKRGESGNPGGRPSQELGALRRQIGDAMPAIMTKLIAKAKEGDLTAIRLLLERVFPPIKAAEQAAPVALPDGSASDQARAILAAVAGGSLAPGQGSQLLQAMGAMAKVIETDELAARIAALEARNAKS
jgi:hypothetical protein